MTRASKRPSGSWWGRALLVLAAAALPAWGATDRWEPYPPGIGGPWGGSVRRIVSPADPGDPSDPLWAVLWAATDGGVFVSKDSGTTWERRSRGLETLDVTDVDVSAADPQRLVLSTASAGVYLSADEGASWSRVPREAMQVAGVPQDRFAAVAVSPVSADHVFAATAWNSFNLLESIDGGQTWTELGTGNKDQLPVTRLALAADGTLFFATSRGEIYRYVAGDTGPVLYHRFPGDPVGIVDLVLPGGTGDAMVASQGGLGVWVRAGAGAGWVQVPVAFGLYAEALAADPRAPERVLVFANGLVPEKVLFEVPDLANPALVEIGLPEEAMEILSLFVTDHAEWLGENKAGLFRRAEGEAQFVPCARGPAAYTPRDVAFDPRTRGRFAVAGGGANAPGNGGLGLWDPAIQAWERRSGGFPAALNEEFSTTLVRYLGSALWVAAESVGDGGGLYRSADGGVTWENRSEGIALTGRRAIFGLLSSPAAPARLLCGTETGVHRSVDGGATWSPQASLPGTGAWRLALDPRPSHGFFVAGHQMNTGRFFTSDEAGVVWQEGASLPNQIAALAASQQVPGHVLAGTRISGAGAQSGVFESFDGGESWSRATAEIPAGVSATAVAIGEAGGYHWMAAYVDETGVYVSRDAGATWSLEPLWSGLPVVPTVTVLGFEPDTPRLVAGVRGGGLWYLDLVEDTSPPSGTAAVEGGKALTSDPVVRLALTAEDPGGRVADVRLRDEGGSWASWGAYGGVKTWTLSGADGLKTIEVQFRDWVGNLSLVTSASIDLDTVPPQVLITAPSEGRITSEQSPVLRFAAEPGAAVTVAVDGVEVQTTSGEALGGLGDGAHTVSVGAVDAAGNRGSAEVSFTVDTVPPKVSVTSPPSGATGERSPELLYETEAGATVSVTVDDVGVAARSGEPLGPLADGAHTVLVEAVDAAGNRGSVEVAFTVDTLPPAVLITSPSPGATGERSPELLYEIEAGATVSVIVDGVGVTVRSGQPLGPLADGAHTVLVEAVDAAGNRGSAEVSFEVIAEDEVPASGGGGGGGGGCFVGLLGGLTW